MRLKRGQPRADAPVPTEEERAMAERSVRSWVCEHATNWSENEIRSVTATVAAGLAATRPEGIIVRAALTLPAPSIAGVVDPDPEVAKRALRWMNDLRRKNAAAAKRRGVRQREDTTAKRRAIEECAREIRARRPQAKLSTRSLAKAVSDRLSLPSETVRRILRSCQIK